MILAIETFSPVEYWERELTGLTVRYSNHTYRSSMAYCSDVECAPMTAIADTYVSSQGFAIGADGLRVDARSGTTITETAEKIFSIEASNLTFAYAWAGATHMIRDNGPDFDLLGESKFILQSVANARPNSMQTAFVSMGEYVGEFVDQLYTRLRTICLPDGRLSANPDILPRNDIARMLLVGYLNEEPYRAIITVSHRDLFLLKPRVDEIVKAPDDFNMFSGSPKVYYEEFASTLEEPASLTEAASLIRRYIQACIDRRDREPECKHIGGRIRLAFVTPRKVEFID